MSARMNYLDGNAAGGELSHVFAMDITSAQGQCANCGAEKRFGETHLHVQCPGLIARCPQCEHILLRFTHVHNRVFLDLRGMMYLTFDAAEREETGGRG